MGLLVSEVRAGNEIASLEVMYNTFTHKLLTTIAAGFAAACLFWVFRHFVEQSFYESNEGWKDMYKNAPARRVH